MLEREVSRYDDGYFVEGLRKEKCLFASHAFLPCAHNVFSSLSVCLSVLVFLPSKLCKKQKWCVKLCVYHCLTVQTIPFASTPVSHA